MNRAPSHFRWMLIAVVAVLLTAVEAYARAGGGGGYHGGGGGGGGGGGFHFSGGGSHGGGGSGFDLFWIILTAIHHPIISLVIVAIIVLIVKFGGNSTSTASSVVGPTAPAREQSLADLRAHDPNFDEDIFLGRVKTAFDKIQAAWCAQDLRSVRPFISDGVYERFSLQFEEQKAEGYRDHMADISVGRAFVVALSSPGVFDEISVRVDAAARDWRESLADGSRISGSKGIEPFTEVWTFVRRRGATTDTTKSGLIEGNCPNCGAPIELNQSANCSSCGALLRSGTYDWVLTEITQESEWRRRNAMAAPGVAEISSRDPDFDAAALEDRASVIYWRKATADRTGKVDALRKVALPQFADAYAQSLRPPPSGPRKFIADSAVGSVELRGVLSDGQWDRAVVEIRWSGFWFATDPSAQMRRGPEAVGQESLFILARQAGAKSDAGKAISSAHCPNCGAPESKSASNACEACGTVLNDGAHGWVLEEIAHGFIESQPWIQRLRGENMT